MDRLLERLWKLVARAPVLTLQVRLFRLICLTVGTLCLAVVLPVNLLQHLPVQVNVADVVLGLFALFCYRESGRGRNHIISFLIVLVLLMDPTWFANGGSQGSITYYFFPALLFPMVLCRGKTRWLLSALLVANVVGLLLLEYYFPALVIPFQRPTDKLLDLITGVICACLCMTVIVWVILANYDREQELLSRYARDLAASEKNYREVVENAKSIILRLDAHGRIRFFNKFAEELFGYTRQEIIGQHVVGTIVPRTSEKGENLSAMVEQVLQRPDKFGQMENENICRDGRRIRVNWTNQPVYDEHGQLLEILCVGADVTERAELLEKLQLTQTTMDAAAEEIIWVADGGEILYANAALAGALRVSRDAILQLKLTDILTDCTPADWEKHWARLKDMRAITFESFQRSPEGPARPVELSLTHMNLGGKECATAFIRDLTGRKQAEEKRLQQEQQLLHIQKLESVGILAGGIAHDFNNLLTAVLGNISLARMNLPPGQENHELLAEAERASLQAKDLTAQLLTFSKGGRPVKSAVALAPVVHDSVALAARGGSATCVVNFPGDLWPVEADPAQLSQVFNNLLLNAQQAMPQGGEITITGRNRAVGELNEPLLSPGRYVEVTLRDQGVGISPEALPRIFDPYFTTKQSGSGLGLAVAHSIISQHRGVIKAASQIGQGTTFTLWLPATETAPKAQAQTEPPAPPRPHRILVMDDEEMVRKILTKMLTRLGYEVKAAPDGRVAVELFRTAWAESQKFDVVIMDLTVPGGMGGQEAIQHLQQIDPNVKAIVSSGYSDSPVMADHRAYGFADVMLKPYTTDQLKSALQSLLQR